MASISGVIPNVIGGVSQQPPAARLENTATSLKNAVPSVVSGLRKRPPIKWIKALQTKPSGTIAVFEWVRSGKPTKFVVVADQTIKVYSQDGTSEAVTFNQTPANYLPSDALKNVGFMAVGDTLFLYNKVKVVSKGTPSETRTNPKWQYSFVIKQTQPETYFNVYADGYTGSYTQGATPRPADHNARELRDAWNTASGTSTAVTYDNVVSMTFASEKSGSFGSEPTPWTTSYRDELDLFTKLPTNERDNRIVRITGADGAVDASYYVQFDSATRNWVECVGHGQGEYLTDTTMPHKLVDDGDGTWTYDKHTWGSRTCGDSESNPTPSFVGHAIQDLFLTANRLIVLADENVIASEVGEYENFYRTTCTTVLDSDRLDVAALTTDNRVAKLYSGVEFQGGILLFSDRNQFTMDVKGGLSPNTVNLTASTSFLSSTEVRPVKLGTNVLFVDDSDESAWVDLREYMVDQVVGVNTSEVITKQIPQAIPTGVYKLVPNATLGLALTFSSGDRSRIYVYSYYSANNERVQSAWSYWEDDNVEFHSAQFVGNKMYVVFARGTQLILGEMDLQETITGDVGGLEVMLDYRLTQADVTVAFDGTDTTVTLPYDPYAGESYSAVLTADGDLDVKGTTFEGIDGGTNKIIFEGIDLTGESFLIGRKYEFLYVLSPVFLRDDKKVPIQDGRLQLRYMSFLYHRSSYFRVEVTPEGRQTWTDTFTGRTMGAITDIIGSVAVSDGEFKVPCSGEPVKTDIRVINDSPFNCRFSSIEWYGSWRGKTKRT